MEHLLSLILGPLGRKAPPPGDAAAAPGPESLANEDLAGWLAALEDVRGATSTDPVAPSTAAEAVVQADLGSETAEGAAEGDWPPASAIERHLWAQTGITSAIAASGPEDTPPDMPSGPLPDTPGAAPRHAGMATAEAADIPVPVSSDGDPLHPDGWPNTAAGGSAQPADDATADPLPGPTPRAAGAVGPQAAATPVTTAPTGGAGQDGAAGDDVTANSAGRPATGQDADPAAPPPGHDIGGLRARADQVPPSPAPVAPQPDGAVREAAVGAQPAAGPQAVAGQADDTGNRNPDGSRARPAPPGRADDRGDRSAPAASPAAAVAAAPSTGATHHTAPTNTAMTDTAADKTPAGTVTAAPGAAVSFADASLLHPNLRLDGPMAGDPLQAAGGHTGARTQPDHPTGVARQIADAVVSQRDGEVEIALSPEELGRVRLVIGGTERGVQITVTVWFDRPDVLDMMRRNPDQLMQDLRDSGLADARLDLRDGSGGRGDADGLAGRHSESPAGETAAASQPQSTKPDLALLAARAAAGSRHLDIRL